MWAAPLLHWYAAYFITNLHLNIDIYSVGYGEQQALVSWWPLPIQWNNLNGHNWGYWTEWDELWYSQRLSQIRCGNNLGVPFTASEWRGKLRGASVARAVIKGIGTQSEKHFMKK